MGNGFASDLANSDLDLHTSIRYHLRGNHYPPVPVEMVEPCIEAINAYNEEESDRLISLPAGITWRDKTEAPAYAIIEAHHLDNWLNEIEY